MTSPRYTITQQRQAVESLIDLARRDNNCARGEWDEAAKQAVLTLAWIERRADLLKELARLERDAPALATLLREFPGAQIAEIR